MEWTIRWDSHRTAVIPNDKTQTKTVIAKQHTDSVGYVQTSKQRMD